VKSHFIMFLLVKLSFFKVFSNDSYDLLKFHIFACLGLKPDYVPAVHDPCFDYVSKGVSHSMSNLIHAIYLGI
jgi:hypothetical protein